MKARGVLLFALLALVVFTSALPAIAQDVQANAGFPDVGTKWITRTTDDRGNKMERTLTAVAISYRDRPVVAYSDGVDTRVLDKANLNWIATLRDGREIYSASPDNGTFAWPLTVGKWWPARYAYRDNVLGRTFDPVEMNWKVVAYEDVTVPAGTFKAFRLQSWPGMNNATITTLWYAPEVKLVVKRVTERRVEFYRRDTGQSTTEELVRLLKEGDLTKKVE